MSEPDNTAPRLRISVRAVAALVAEDYGLTFWALLNYVGCRRRPIVEARHVGMWLAVRKIGASTATIGLRFGVMDHTTVLHGVRKVEARAQIDPAFAARLERLVARVDAAEAAMLVELADIGRLLRQSDAAPKDAPPAPPSDADLAEAVADYIAARTGLKRALFTAGEREARATAHRAFEVLCGRLDSQTGNRSAV